MSCRVLKTYCFFSSSEEIHIITLHVCVHEPGNNVDSGRHTTSSPIGGRHTYLHDVCIWIHINTHNITLHVCVHEPGNNVDFCRHTTSSPIGGRHTHLHDVCIWIQINTHIYMTYSYGYKYMHVCTVESWRHTVSASVCGRYTSLYYIYTCA